MSNVAILFYSGQGVRRDMSEARDLWRQAMEWGHLNASANLGQDLALAAKSSDAERRTGFAMLREAARFGNGFAQKALRDQGDTEIVPPVSISVLTMKLEPRDPKPGSSKLCGELVS